MRKLSKLRPHHHKLLAAVKLEPGKTGYYYAGSLDRHKSNTYNDLRRLERHGLVHKTRVLRNVDIGMGRTYKRECYIWVATVMDPPDPELIIIDDLGDIGNTMDKNLKQLFYDEIERAIDEGIKLGRGSEDLEIATGADGSIILSHAMLEKHYNVLHRAKVRLNELLKHAGVGT